MGSGEIIQVVETNGSFITEEQFNRLATRYEAPQSEDAIRTVEEVIQSIKTKSKRKETIQKNRESLKKGLNSLNLALTLFSDFSAWVQKQYGFTPQMLGESVVAGADGAVVSSHDRREPSGIKSQVGENGDYYFRDFSGGRFKDGVNNTGLLFNLFLENIEKIKGFEIDQVMLKSVVWAELKRFAFENYGVEVRGGGGITIKSPYGMDFKGEQQFKIRDDTPPSKINSEEAIQIAREMNEELLNRIEKRVVINKLLIYFLNKIDPSTREEKEFKTHPIKLQEIVEALGYRWTSKRQRYEVKKGILTLRYVNFPIKFWNEGWKIRYYGLIDFSEEDIEKNEWTIVFKKDVVDVLRSWFRCSPEILKMDTRSFGKAGEFCKLIKPEKNEKSVLLSREKIIERLGYSGESRQIQKYISRDLKKFKETGVIRNYEWCEKEKKYQIHI